MFREKLSFLWDFVFLWILVCSGSCLVSCRSSESMTHSVSYETGGKVVASGKSRRIPQVAKSRTSDNYGYRAPEKKSKPIAAPSVEETRSPAQSPGKPAPIMITTNGTQSILEVGGAKGDEVLVQASNCVLVINGNCRHLEVTGSGNQIQSSTLQRFSIKGSDNTLIAGTVTGGELSGSNNEVLWGSGPGGAPEIALAGTNNLSLQLE